MAPAGEGGTSTPRFVRQAGAFVLTLGLVLVAVNAAVERLFNTRAELIFAPIFGPVAYEGLVLGSSHALNGVRPTDLDGGGQRFFNAGRQGASPRYMAWWYDRLRETGRRPRVVLVQADWFMFSGNVERHVEHDSGAFPWPLFVRTAIAPETDRKALFGNAFALWRDRGRLQLLLAGRAAADADRMGDARGWVAAGGHPGAFHAFRPAAELFVVRPEQVAALARLHDALAADGVRAVWVQAPEHRPDAPQVQAAQARLAALAAGRRLPFLNYNGERRSALNDDRANFMDWGHLSAEGARRFSARLRQDLEALGVYGYR